MRQRDATAPIVARVTRAFEPLAATRRVRLDSRLDPAARAKRLVHQLTHLGFEVQLHAQQVPASPGRVRSENEWKKVRNAAR